MSFLAVIRLESSESGWHPSGAFSQVVYLLALWFHQETHPFSPALMAVLLNFNSIRISMLSIRRRTTAMSSSENPWNSLPPATADSWHPGGYLPLPRRFSNAEGWVLLSAISTSARGHVMCIRVRPGLKQPLKSTIIYTDYCQENNCSGFFPRPPSPRSFKRKIL